MPKFQRFNSGAENFDIMITFYILSVSQKEIFCAAYTTMNDEIMKVLPITSTYSSIQPVGIRQVKSYVY